MDKITEVLNDFLAEFDCFAEEGEEFAYYPAENKITYTLSTYKNDEETFLSFVSKEFPEIKANIFLWSFLHEIGHHETEDDFTENEIEYYCNNIIGCGDPRIYYYSDIEYAATAWAADYMIENEEKVSQLNNKLNQIIKEGEN